MRHPPRHCSCANLTFLTAETSCGILGCCLMRSNSSDVVATPAWRSLPEPMPAEYIWTRSSPTTVLLSRLHIPSFAEAIASTLRCIVQSPQAFIRYQVCPPSVSCHKMRTCFAPNCSRGRWGTGGRAYARKSLTLSFFPSDARHSSLTFPRHSCKRGHARYWRKDSRISLCGASSVLISGP